MSPEFFQEAPRLGNTFRGDAVLRSYLERRLPGTVRAEVEPGLERLGEMAAGEMLRLADAAEASPPRHLPFDPWGRRVDRIEVSPAWRRLHDIAAREGVVAAAYERRHGEHSRVDQFARLYLYHPSSAIASCPLAMTDGAARVLELYGGPELRARALPRLTSRDPASFWTSGQWMTERTGGSDVSGTSTVARPDGEGFRLYGSKWFTSATTAEMALALARIEGAPAGSQGLSLFYLELRDEAGDLQGIRIHRLKDKLGTRALPTAELTLEGAPARLVGEAGRGVATVATMLNVTRLYNACCAVGYMARGLALARDYARRRTAFGRSLAEQPLHLETLAGLAAEHRAAFHLTFRAVELLGREEVGVATAEERALLRLLTPLAKLATAKRAVAVASEVLECFGGAGYVEDTGLPRLLRDTQVLSIWEGTTNVLALDLLRAIAKEGSLPVLLADLEERLASHPVPQLAAVADQARERALGAARWLDGAGAGGAEGSRAGAEAPQALAEARQAGARRFAFELYQAYAGALLAEQAAWELGRGGGQAASAAARRWSEKSFPGEPLDCGDLRALALGEG